MKWLEAHFLLSITATPILLNRREDPPGNPQERRLGHNPNPLSALACQLSPAADKPSFMPRPAVCQSTKSLRDSPLRGQRSCERCPQGRDHWWRTRRPVLRIEVSPTSSKTGVTHDHGYCQPVAPADDRGHERAQTLCGHAEGPHPQLQAVCCVSQAVS